MPDIRPRPCFDRAAASEHRQFSLAANMTFQFWDPTRPRPADHPPEITDHWWFQPEEPEPPPGWTADSYGWQQDPNGVRSRLIIHRDEPRRLNAEQLAVLGIEMR